MKAFAFVFIFGLFFYSCNSRDQNCCAGKVDTFTGKYEIPDTVTVKAEDLKIPDLNKWFTYTALNPGMGFHFIQKEGITYLSGINGTQDTLLFINIFDSADIKKVPFAKIAQPGQNYLAYITASYLHFVDVKKHIYYGLELDSGFNVIPRWKVSLENFISFKGKYLNSNLLNDDFLTFAGNKLLIPYGVFNKNPGDIRQASVLSFDTLNVKLNQILSNPEEMSCPSFRFMNFNLIKETDSTVVISYPKINLILRFNVNDDIITDKADRFNFESHFICYDKSKEEILPYVSNYDLTDEENSRIIKNGNFFYLIKRLRRVNPEEHYKIAILKFNAKLKHISTILPEGRVSPRLSFAFKYGIGILNDSLNKIKYYEF